MLRQTRMVNVQGDSDIAEAVSGVQLDGDPRLLVRDGEAIAVIVSARDFAEYDDSAAEMWRNYDGERVRAALRASAGALAGTNVDQLRAELRDARGQDSEGRAGS